MPRCAGRLRARRAGWPCRRRAARWRRRAVRRRRRSRGPIRAGCSGWSSRGRARPRSARSRRPGRCWSASPSRDRSIRPSEKPTRLAAARRGGCVAVDAHAPTAGCPARGASRAFTRSPIRVDARGAITLRQCLHAPRPGRAGTTARRRRVSVRDAASARRSSACQRSRSRWRSACQPSRCRPAVRAPRDPGHDDRTMRGRLAVVQALVVDRHAEEAGRAERDVARVLLLERPADRLLALVDAEHELRARAARRRRPPAGRGGPPARRGSCGDRCARRLRGTRAGASRCPDRRRTRPTVAPARRRRGRRSPSGDQAAAARHAPEDRRVEHGRTRPGRRHAAPEGGPRPGRSRLPGRRCSHRPPLEEQPDGEELLERRRRAAGVFLGMVLEPREHPGPAGQGQGRG